MKERRVIPVDQLSQEPYASVLCFPKPSETELQSRIQELRTLGVSALEFSGKVGLFGVGLSVLGKGYVGIVVIAHSGGQRMALKMRRVDADRQSLEHEAALLVKANGVDVGPRFIAANRDFLLMQLIEGELLADWLESLNYRRNVRKVIVDILEQCWRLDDIGLDHGELSKAPKHLLVDKFEKPFIVDFETASVDRRVANVTAVCQFLFMGKSPVSKILAETLGEADRGKLLEALKAYKTNRTRTNFENLMKSASSQIKF